MEAGNEVGTDWGTKILIIVGVFSFIIALAVMGAWFAMGAAFVTQYQVATTQVEADEFGDEIETTVMKDEFQFGLFPDKGYDGAAPVAGGFAVLGLVLIVAARARRREE